MGRMRTVGLIAILAFAAAVPALLSFRYNGGLHMSLDTASPEALFRRCIEARDAEAWREFHARYHRFIAGVVWRLLAGAGRANVDEIEEIVPAVEPIEQIDDFEEDDFDDDFDDDFEEELDEDEYGADAGDDVPDNDDEEPDEFDDED